MVLFNMSNILSLLIEEIDMSYTNRIYYGATIMSRLKKIKMVNATFEQQFVLNLNIELLSLDFSNTNFLSGFDFLTSLLKLEELSLSQLNISSMDPLKIETFKNLKRLDLSYNALTRVTFVSLSNANNLEVLNLGHNQISFMDARIFSTPNYLTNLRHLNLERNQLHVLSSDLSNLKRLFSLRVSFNRLEQFPILKMPLNLIDTLVNEIHFDHNELTSVEANIFSLATSYVETLSLNGNRITSISDEAFSFLKSLTNLSLAHNNLTRVNNKHFYNLFGLKYLNLSYNSIIELESTVFENMNNLRVLDLSFNKLIQLKEFQFFGLKSLTVLHLSQGKTFRKLMSLSEKSFDNLTSIRDVYLDYDVIVEEKCFFMHGIHRPVQRRVNQGKYVFYRSLNLLTSLSMETVVNMCDLKFEYLQFKVHFNLKYDVEFERFFEECKMSLLTDFNSYTNTLSSCLKTNNKNITKGKTSEAINSFVKSAIASVLSNFVYLLTMFVLIAYLGPIFFLILIHLFFASTS